MEGYADYDFYLNSWHGQMEEMDFSRNILSASQYIRYVTAGKSDSYDGEELKYASCEAADAYYQASMDMAGGKGRVKSENNDGYSVTYAAEGKDGETSESLTARKVYGIVRKWLLPTGLLSRKVGCRHDCECGYYSL